MTDFIDDILKKNIDLDYLQNKLISNEYKDITSVQYDFKKSIDEIKNEYPENNLSKLKNDIVDKFNKLTNAEKTGFVDKFNELTDDKNNPSLFYLPGGKKLKKRRKTIRKTIRKTRRRMRFFGGASNEAMEQHRRNYLICVLIFAALQFYIIHQNRR